MNDNEKVTKEIDKIKIQKIIKAMDISIKKLVEDLDKLEKDELTYLYKTRYFTNRLIHLINLIYSEYYYKYFSNDEIQQVNASFYYYLSKLNILLKNMLSLNDNYYINNRSENINNDDKVNDSNNLKFMYTSNDKGNYSFYNFIADDLKDIKVKEFLNATNLSNDVYQSMKTSVHQQKNTVIATAIGLKYSLEKTQELLNKCGYHLSPYIKRDKFIIDYIAGGIIDIYDINAKLYDLDMTMLGTKDR